jgi:flagellin
VETAEGAMQEVTSILQRMRELAIQSASDTNSDADRTFLQNEIDQLSTELDRIASTTQYNGINVLDGSYSNKVFQIGANAGQTMNISIGSMSSGVLGVATSNSAAVASSSLTPTNTTTTATTGGATAKGTEAVQTVVNLEFLNNSGQDAYVFKITDSNSGLTAEVATLTVDMTNSVSKDAFVAALNLSAATGQTDTVVTGANSFSSTIGGTLDLTNSANYGKVRFAISVDGGATTQIDLRDKLISTSGLDSSSVRQTQIIAALDAELERLFDARVGASATTTDKIQIEDQSGRRLKVTQGAGDGTMFGTDAVNAGGLLANQTTRNNLTFAFNGDNLVATNTAGGKVALSNYSAQNNSQVLFNTVTDSQAEGVNEPVLLSIATGNPGTMATATYSGNVESSSLSVRFSDKVGSGSTAQYSFQITNGAGDIYASFTDLQLNGVDDATIQASVLAALATGIGNLDDTDSSFDRNEFEVTFSGDQLIVSNSQGRALAVENFSSTHGFLTVTPINEPGAAQILASQNAYYSETRVQLNTSTFGQDLSADNTPLFAFTLDGVNGSADLTIDVNGSSTGGLKTGADFASAIQTAVRASDNTINNPNSSAAGGGLIATADLSNITVTFDADTAELVFRDDAGRAMGFSYAGSSTLTTSNGPLLEEVTGAANKGLTVKRDFTGVAQGDVLNATEVTLTFSTADTSFNFTLNGKYLDGASTNSSAAMSAGVAVSATFGSDTGTLQNKLNSLMSTLNAAHPSSVFEYEIDGTGKAITLRQRDGGELLIGGFVTESSHKDLTAAVTTPSGQGTAQTLIFQNHDKALLATAVGTQGVATAATLTLSGDDVYSMTVSDGTQSYTASNLIVDVDDTTSTNNFGNALTEAFLGSGINVTMDTSGNVFFRRSDGGAVILQSLTAAQGSTAVWTPDSGQGTSYNVTGTGSVAGSTSTTISTATSSSTSGSSSVSSSGDSIANMSIASQAGATQAISTIDAAVSYVQAERSNLGAIQNRLTYTVDNLTNAMTNAASARSRVLDTDYAKETAELARAQIIQQAATAMLAQANQQPQIVLALLQ